MNKNDKQLSVLSRHIMWNNVEGSSLYFCLLSVFFLLIYSVSFSGCFFNWFSVSLFFSPPVLHTCISLSLSSFLFCHTPPPPVSLFFPLYVSSSRPLCLSAPSPARGHGIRSTTWSSLRKTAVSRPRSDTAPLWYVLAVLLVWVTRGRGGTIASAR